MQYTRELPTKEGYYWWTNFGEHTPCILKLEFLNTSRGKPTKQLYASNEEFSFWVEKKDQLSLFDREEDEKPRYVCPASKEEFYYGDELWAYIEPANLNDYELKESCF